MKQCEHCGQDYQPKRATARFCSPACRVKASRGTPTSTSPQKNKEPGFGNPKVVSTPKIVNSVRKAQKAVQEMAILDFCAHGFPKNGWSCKHHCK